MLNKAIKIAVLAHGDQMDRCGKPYILHPLRVMFRLQGEQRMICGVLHDVVEDTTVTLDDLREQLFNEDIIDIIGLLTRTKDMAYEDYIKRMLHNGIACDVKLADIEDNTDKDRLGHLTAEEAWQLCQKYEAAREQILDRWE